MSVSNEINVPLTARMLEILARSPVLLTDDVVSMRAAAVAGKKAWNAAARKGVHVVEGRLPGSDSERPALFVEADACRSRPIVHIHGGGWCICDLESHFAVFAALAKASQRKIIAPHARRAPEHPFPAALDDTISALRFVSDQNPSGVYLSGDSAGANLALAALLKCRDIGRPLRVRAISLQYGCFRRKFDTRSHEDWGDGRAGLSTERMRWFWDAYNPGSSQYGDLSDADLSGLPPVHVLAAGADPLLDDSIWFSRKLERAGVEHHLDLFLGVAHGFLHYAKDLPEADEAFEKIAMFFARERGAGIAAEPCD